MEIYLIRHTTPDITKGLIYGRMNVLLSATFPEEKEIIQRKIPRTPDRVFSSPSSRCTLLAETFSPQYKTDERLYEFDFGNWEGKTWDGIDQNELKVWMEDYVNVCTPEGENMLLMQKRVIAFWEDLLKENSKSMVVVTHGGVIRLILSHLNKAPLTKAFEFKIGYGDVYLIEPLADFKIVKL